jgi:hypothetical protein
MDPKVVELTRLLQGDLVTNMGGIERAAQEAVKALSLRSGLFNAEQLHNSLLTLDKGPITRLDSNSDPASYLRNVLKGDIRVVLIAALAGRPIAYPLLALKRALESRYDPQDITVAYLLNVIRGFDIQKFEGPVDIIKSLSLNAPTRSSDDAALLDIMMPQVRVGGTDFIPNPIMWSESYVPIPIPNPRIENRPIIPIPTLTHSGGGGGDTTKQGPGDSDSNRFMPILITLLLVCVAALALIKGNGR